VAGGTDVRIFDVSGDQLQAAREYVARTADGVRETLGLRPRAHLNPGGGPADTACAG